MNFAWEAAKMILKNQLNIKIVISHSPYESNFNIPPDSRVKIYDKTIYVYRNNKKFVTENDVINYIIEGLLNKRDDLFFYLGEDGLVKLSEFLLLW